MAPVGHGACAGAVLAVGLFPIGFAIAQTLDNGSSHLEYDATADRYTYVWKTERVWTSTCRKLVIKLDDGSTHLANFKFVR